MNLFKVSVSLAVFYLSASFATALSHGLGDVSKSFTDPAHMRQSDWSDPKEIRRT